MRIGYVFLPERGATDAVLTEVAAHLLAEGVPVAGAVQSNTGCDIHCDMDVRVLPDGPVIRISQRLGAGSSGCRLDAGALEVAVMEVAARLAGARLLVVNKFGKHEAEGRGFRQMLAEVAGDGVPVLIGINSMNRQAFFDFAGDLAEEVAPERALDWARLVVAEGV
ncbi:Protein of unknown function [Gemmobacter aquatilis]|uniref:Nucleoside-triphosphatase THEP1 n=1 Tax=Gemmobacter aquatilis TaxID=933059 RepID=A0A1H8H6V8_9RHOB|nr:DUF2478 domain-containing protein [Gemmobacter aquatilis]SEN51248.1 Protein of unknown function [Gemmobacter aquatilis]